MAGGKVEKLDTKKKARKAGAGTVGTTREATLRLRSQKRKLNYSQNLELKLQFSLVLVLQF